MASLTQLQTDRDNLEAAINSGAQSGSVDGQTTTFQSPDAMRAVLRDIVRQIALLEETDQKRPRVSRITMTGGV